VRSENQWKKEEAQAGRGQSWGWDVPVLCSSTITSWECCVWDGVAGASHEALAWGWTQAPKNPQVREAQATWLVPLL